MPSVELMALAAPRVATALACWLTGKTTEAWRIAEDVLRCTTERDVPQARAVAAVTAAIMAQLDGDRGKVSELAVDAVRAADEVTTRQWQQWARSLQWWAGEGPHEPELPGPLLRPYFEMLLADDVLASVERARALLDDALRTARTTGEQFCEAEILRMRAGVMRRNRQVELAGRDYEEAADGGPPPRRSHAGAPRTHGLVASAGRAGSRPRRPRDLRRRHGRGWTEPESRRCSQGDGGDMTRTTWDDAFLDGLRTQADPPADFVVAGLFSGTQDASAAFRALVVEQHELADSDLKAFLDEQPPAPPWMDPDLVAAGQERFARWGSHVFTALYAASLPSAYACRRGVQVLGLTARLETDTKRRLNETAQFHLDVMEPGALDAGGRGYADVRHVRLMHAAVRWLIQNDPRVEWDPAWGTPINQEDLLETLLTFTEIVFEVFDRTGIVYSEEDADAYLHTWSLIGHYLGIREDLLPLTRSQTSVLMPIVRRRQFGPSKPGPVLMAALLEQGTRLAPPGLRGLPASTVRYYVGDATADLLDVPKANWTRNLFEPLADLSRRVSLEKLHRRLLQAVSEKIGFGMLSLAVRAERYGDRPAFEVPTSLAARWNIPPYKGPGGS